MFKYDVSHPFLSERQNLIDYNHFKSTESESIRSPYYCLTVDLDYTAYYA